MENKTPRSGSGKLWHKGSETQEFLFHQLSLSSEMFLKERYINETYKVETAGQRIK